MILEAAYLSTLLCGACFIVLRPEPTLVRGDVVLILTASFACAAVISWFRAGEIGPAAPFWGVSLAISLVARSRWLLVHISGAKTAVVVERSLEMILLPFEKKARAYRLDLRGGPAFVEIQQASGVGVILILRGNWRHKKARLLRGLLAKAFRPVFPRVRIDLR